jgi:PPK2 family polyphosphate:nucleotide phosphotransferase
MHPWKRYRLRPGKKLRLGGWNPAERIAEARSDHRAKETLRELLPQLDQLQGLLYAEHRHRVLAVLQGMDTAGKDATIRRVFQGVNPQGVRVARFGPPSVEELEHDFLWRVHPHVPRSGEIVIFNRSHYEDVLWPRVHREISEEETDRRIEAIRDFERLLVEQGTTLLKFFLLIDRAEQARRLEARLQDPTKHWKFSVHDLAERPLWPKYLSAYEEAIERTNTPDAPWFVVPSDHPLSRDVVVAMVLLRALERLRMRYPPLDPAVRSQLRRLGSLTGKGARSKQG